MTAVASLSAQSKVRVWAPWIAIVVVVAGALMFAALQGRSAQTPDARARSLATQLRCLECQGLSVADSRTTTAEGMKAEIRRRIDAGESDGQIRAAFVARYGEFVLQEPQSGLVWWLPIVVIGVGGAAIAVVIARAARRRRSAATDEDRALVAAAMQAKDDE